jgi:hypothetical protein
MRLIGNWLKKVKLNFLFWVMKQKWYQWLMINVVPFLRLSTYYAMPSNENFIKWGPLMRRGYKKIQPGDIILTVDKKKLAAKVIGSATADHVGDHSFVPSHAALCVAKGEDFEIAEMTHHDFTRSTWEDVCYESTRVVILRCSAFDEYYINEVLIPECLSFKDKKYDTSFSMGVDELICSELVYFADKERRLVVNLDPILGFKPYISPIGLYKAKNCFVVWDSNEEGNEQPH